MCIEIDKQKSNVLPGSPTWGANSMYHVHQSRIQQAMKECPTAKKVLEILFPEAIENKRKSFLTLHDVEIAYCDCETSSGRYAGRDFRKHYDKITFEWEE